MALETPPREPTPEERLFKIIQEGKSASVSVTENVPADISPEEDLSAREPEGLRVKKARRAKTVFDDAAIRGLGKRFFTLETVNRLLLTCLITLFIYFASTQVLWKESLSDAFMQKSNALVMPPVGLSPELLSVGDLGTDLADVSKRNLFQPYRPPEPSAQAPVEAPPPTPGNILSQVSGHLKLSGIYMSDEPEALLEATDEKKTYAVSAGSQIKGIKVKEVRADGVVLTDGQSEKVIQ